MSYDDDSEKHDHSLFGLHVNCTHEEQRRLQLKLSEARESREWGICHHMLTIIDAPVPMQVHDSLAERMEEADRVMTKLAFRLIEEMLKER